MSEEGQERPVCSVVIPIGPDETELQPLLDNLARLPPTLERILVLCPKAEGLLKGSGVSKAIERQQILVINAKQGRARQQNAGVRSARGDFIWFLHADSQLTEQHWLALEKNLRRSPEALHFFRLAFAADGPRTMAINAWGANLRSYLGIPFGDQGFCLARRTFERLQGFDETAPYGEDHLLVWRAHQLRVALNRVEFPLVTSARRYRNQGWGRLTLRYQWLWIRQAIPQFYRLLQLRCADIFKHDSN